VLTVVLSFLVPLLQFLVTLCYYTLVQKRELSAAIVFSAVTGFDLLRTALFQLVVGIPSLIQATVSAGRVEEFLNNVSFCVCVSPLAYETKEPCRRSCLMATHRALGLLTRLLSTHTNLASLRPPSRGQSTTARRQAVASRSV
jgi:hypothetical protein